MQLSILIAESARNLFTSRLRSFLAILGILVGTGSVVAMISIGFFAEEQSLEQYKNLGSNLLSVSMYSKERSQSSMKTGLSVDEALQIEHLSPDIINAAPYITQYQRMFYEGKALDGSIIGSNESLQKIIKIKVAEGRFISDLDNYKNFAVIGTDILSKLREIDPATSDFIGKHIMIGNQFFTIIGIADKWPENAFFSYDINRTAVIPLTTSSRLGEDNEIENIILQLKEGYDIDKLTQLIENNINSHTKGKNIQIRSAKEIIKSMEQQSRIFTLLLGMIGSITLTVGGIGVMNIMLVSVVERRREIGIRKAIGAKRHDILMQFLIESMAIAIFGGVFGILFGLGVAFIVAQIASWKFAIYLGPPLVGFIVSTFVGVFFGLYPAYRASCLDPITALRTD